MTPASVIVNNHDYASYVGEAVDSALDQTWPDTEVVVVDDGSTDGSRELLADYGDRIRLVLRPRRGQTAAMNAGFAASTGDVVVFLDADDVLLPHAVESAVAALRAGAVKAHWPVSIVDAAGLPAGPALPDAPLPWGDLRSRALTEGPQSLPFPPTSGNAWRRDFLSSVCPLPELEPELGIGSASADALLSMLAALLGEVVALPDRLTRYRVHGGNDYAGADLPLKVDRHVAVTDRHFAVLARHCEARGLPADVAGWQRSSYFHRVQRVRRALLSAVPAGGVALVVDEGHWGPSLVPERRLVSFPDRGGSYWGPLPDDAAAVAELERARCVHGATHLALAWHCAWWLDAYPDLARQLRSHPLVISTEDVVAFDLTGAPA